MKVLDSPYRYLLDNVDNTNENQNVIQFIKKNEQGETVQDGTTTEDVIKMLIDRISIQSNKLPLTIEGQHVRNTNAVTIHYLSLALEKQNQAIILLKDVK